MINAKLRGQRNVAGFPHGASDLAMAPVKMFPYMMEDTESQHEDGLRTVVAVIKKIGLKLGLGLKKSGRDTVDKIINPAIGGGELMRVDKVEL